MEIRFDYDRAKATQVVLWLVHKHLGTLDKLKLVKLVFFADREHLARYGRPIVGGYYHAMPHGPVPSELLDDLNEACNGENPAFTTEGNHIVASVSVNEELLSESDLEVLEEINTSLGKHDGLTLRQLTHDLRAWRENFKQHGLSLSHPLPYEDFFLDLPDRKGILDLIKEDQEARAPFD